MRFIKRHIAQQGFTLVELTIVLAIASLLALYTVRAKTLETDQTIAKMVGLHVDTVGAAAEAYLISNYLNLSQPPLQSQALPTP